MGRSQTFDRDAALDAAMHAFWKHGYTGLGVRKLEELTRINRFSLQTEFGGKTGLFLTLVNSYAASWDSHFGSRLRDGGLEAIIGFFQSRVKDSPRNPDNMGCMVCNLLGDGQPDDPEIRRAISDFLDLMQRAFAAALKNEQQRGTLAADLDIEDTSHMLLNALIGMNVLIKVHGRNTAAAPITRSMEKIILSWRAS